MHRCSEFYSKEKAFNIVTISKGRKVQKETTSVIVIDKTGGTLQNKELLV